VQLRNAVAAHFGILPVVSAQLKDASHQVEQAVTQVGANFGSMVQRAREGVEQASRLIGSAESEGGVEALIATSRTTLEGMLDRLIRDGEACTVLVARLDALERDMEQIGRALEDVDKIAFGNTILALNARIEAVHIGERGQGFELVAHELWSQAQKSKDITEGIRSTIVRLGTGAKAAQEELGKLACADRKLVAGLQHEVKGALGVLEDTHSRMRSSLADAARRGEALAAEISGAVVTLQFQDRVSQQIAHIVDALETMRAAVARPLEGLSPESGTQASVEVLSGTYTMGRERAIHAGVLGQQAEEAAEPDVELF